MLKLRLFLLCFFALGATSAVNAQGLPYAQIYPLLQDIEDLARFDRIVAPLTLTSQLEGVSPPDIELTIEVGGEVMTISPDASGVISIPANAAWAEAGVLIRSNQPPGSQSLNVTPYFVNPPGLEFSYGWLLENRRQFQRAARELQVMFQNYSGIDGVTFNFPPGTEATLSIVGQDELQPLRANSNGVINFRFNDEMAQARPTFKLSQMPERIQSMVLRESGPQ